jgi:hypothetical protein
MSTPTMRTPMPVLHDREKVVYEQCCSLLRQLGFRVSRLSQPRKSKQSLGLADLWATHAVKGALWMECKTDVGKQSPPQRDFQLGCLEANIACICGGMAELIHWLNKREVLRWPRRLQGHPEIPNPAAGGRMLDLAIVEFNRRRNS